MAFCPRLHLTVGRCRATGCWGGMLHWGVESWPVIATARKILPLPHFVMFQTAAGSLARNSRLAISLELVESRCGSQSRIPGPGRASAPATSLRPSTALPGRPPPTGDQSVLELLDFQRFSLSLATPAGLRWTTSINGQGLPRPGTKQENADSRCQSH